MPPVDATPAELRAELADVMNALGRDELRVLVDIAQRLRMGASQYGSLDVVGDVRDWRREAVEELLDGCVYLACEALRTGPSPAEVAYRVARVRSRRVAAEGAGG